MRSSLASLYIEHANDKLKKKKQIYFKIPTTQIHIYVLSASPEKQIKNKSQGLYYHKQQSVSHALVLVRIDENIM